MPENTPQEQAESLTPQTYTPWVVRDQREILNDTGWGEGNPRLLLADREESATTPDERVANLKLAAAARNSYARHCGPNAIQCAEGDLLGEALASIIRTYQDGDIKSLSAVYYKLRDLGIIDRIEAEQGVES